VIHILLEHFRECVCVQRECIIAHILSMSYVISYMHDLEKRKKKKVAGPSLILYQSLFVEI